MRILGQVFVAIDILISWLAGIALWGMTLVLFVNSLARYFAGFSFVGGGELAQYLMVWLAFLGSYLLVRVQRHITVDLFAVALPLRARKLLDLIVGIVGAVLLGYIAWLGAQLTLRIFNTGQVMSSLPILRGYLYLAVPVGCGLMSLAYIFQVFVLLLGGQLPRQEDYGLTSEIPDVELENAHDRSGA
ncbi:TRAP transporter small permease [Pusillimonas noertemannii]|uniref:TRAP transporter small permease protein n=1 Tax=Pusillimonas noertemannii TaxID=305977 RepID=A0A2U1CKN5_9BURK|nr:TRAP transporter small permease [Pusillimonas noertemannii]NYT69077.1 TRAP transporter small permease [Pusillimonas noertemannii]PVY61544.1 C4-dicarboxylate transporter DctQ subunit [Pusillimonas noertemannii]TFL09493.1 TRAP transporter small permease [Pusillimonas noertemannii]